MTSLAERPFPAKRRAKAPGSGRRRAPRPPLLLVHQRAAEAAKRFGVQADDLFGLCRKGQLTAARWAAWRALHLEDGFGFAPIARAWGCDHTSIINARDRGWRLGHA